MLRCLIFNVPGVRGSGLAPQASTHSRAATCRAGACASAVASLPTTAPWALHHAALAHTAAAHTRARGGRGQRVVARLSVAPGATAVTPLSFRDLGLSDELLAAVESLSLERPTEIQAAAVPAILRGGDVVMASHTGSGKTLAYLLPLVQRIRAHEASTGFRVRPKRPRAVVVEPTRELAQQVLGVAKSLCHHARFSSALISGGDKVQQQRELLSQPRDVLVGTPGRLKQLLEGGDWYCGDVQLLVIDEADTLFDAGFGPDIQAMVQPVLSVGGHVVLVTATLTKAVEKLLMASLPQAKRVATSSLHRAVPGAKHRFVDVPGDSDKLDVLRTLLSAEARGDKSKRTMVFCNTVPSCRAVEHALSEAGLTTVSYHGDMTPEARVESLGAFTDVDPLGGDRDDLLSGADSPIMVCTDLAARGLDFACAVEHVIQFDFPLNPVDYIHRTGRTARAGAVGRITSLVTKRDRVLADQIEEQVKKGGALDDLSSSRAVVVRKLEEVAAKRRAARAGPAGGAPGKNTPRRSMFKGTRGAGRFASADARPGGAKKDGPAAKRDGPAGKPPAGRPFKPSRAAPKTSGPRGPAR